MNITEPTLNQKQKIHKPIAVFTLFGILALSQILSILLWFLAPNYKFMNMTMAISEEHFSTPQAFIMRWFGGFGIGDNGNIISQIITLAASLVIITILIIYCCIKKKKLLTIGITIGLGIQLCALVFSILYSGIFEESTLGVFIIGSLPAILNMCITASTVFLLFFPSKFSGSWFLPVIIPMMLYQLLIILVFSGGTELLQFFGLNIFVWAIILSSFGTKAHSASSRGYTFAVIGAMVLTTLTTAYFGNDYLCENGVFYSSLRLVFILSFALLCHWISKENERIEG